jgi:hypothetical protein
MRAPQKLVMWGVLVMAAAGLLLSGCAGAKHKPGEVFACVPDAKLEKSVAPEAQLEVFTCQFKKYEGYETLHFKVGIKNVSDKDQRYRVNIFLDNGKSAGGFIPTKGTVKAGESASFEYPILQMETEPEEVTLNIRTTEP